MLVTEILSKFLANFIAKLIRKLPIKHLTILQPKSLKILIANLSPTASLLGKPYENPLTTFRHRLLANFLVATQPPATSFPPN